MKLRLLKDYVIANQDKSLPHLRYKKGDVINTEDEYIINTMLTGKAAEKAKKAKDDDGKKAMSGPHKNKMMDAELKNKTL